MSKHDFASTQFNIPSSLASHVEAAARKIPSWALAENGHEDEPHVTVKYGLHTDRSQDVAKAIEGHAPFRVRLGKTSVFPDSGHGDVVKVDVHSPELRKLNRRISSALEHTDKHPEYKPHVTLAYVKPGLGNTIAAQHGHPLEGKEVTVDNVVFSDKNGNRTKLPLGKNSEHLLRRLAIRKQ